MSKTNAEKRAEFAGRLRELADWIENTEGLPLPEAPRFAFASHHLGRSPADRKRAMQTFAAQVPGLTNMNIPDEDPESYNSTYAIVLGRVAGFEVDMWARREDLV